MLPEFRLFLAHSFAQERLNAAGDLDEAGISDQELADQIANWIEQFSHGRIEVIRTRDPFREYISSAVQRDLAASDFVLCIFTKRTKDQLTNRWIPSTYVISEAAGAFVQFPTDDETLKRLHGLMEDGVDRKQLGMAFHSGRTIHEFRRDQRAALAAKVNDIVDSILERPTPRSEREYLSMDKRVSVWGNGAVLVETRHQFRFAKAPNGVIRIPHTMWRVSDELPDLESLLSAKRGTGVGFLRCFPLDCGHAGQRACSCRIIPGTTSEKGNEHDFQVEVTGLEIKSGEELSYAIAWGYPNAFAHTEAKSGQPNSVGMRTGGRGTAQHASLTLMFERDEEEPGRILEEPPVVYGSSETTLPASPSASRFWHDRERWSPLAELRPCGKNSGAVFEVYRWVSEMFSGTVKIEFKPHLNYFGPRGAKSFHGAPVFD